jgi:hypothetical protein
MTGDVARAALDTLEMINGGPWYDDRENILNGESIVKWRFAPRDETFPPMQNKILTEKRRKYKWGR